MSRLEEVTRQEERWRERWLSVFLDRVPRRIQPDHFTQMRLVLVIAAATLYLLHQDFRWQLGLLITASLTDLVDGPLARRRGLVHLEGARLDQRADMLLGIWLGVLTLEASALPVWLILALIFSQGLIWAVEAWGARQEAQHNGQGAARDQHVHEGLTGFGTGATPAKPNLASRAQFVLIITGFLSVLSDAMLGWPTRTFGIACLVAAVVAALAQTYARAVAAQAAGPADSTHTRPPATRL